MCSPVERFESNTYRAEQSEWIHVCGGPSRSAPGAPVHTRSHRAAGVPCKGRSDRCSAVDSVAAPNARPDRFVRRDQTVGMLHRHRRFAADLPREPDHPVAGGEHRCAGLDGEIDAAVTRVPLLIRCVETGDHRRSRCERRAVFRRARVDDGGNSEQEGAGQRDVGEEDDEAPHDRGAVWDVCVLGVLGRGLAVHEDLTHAQSEKLHRGDGGGDRPAFWVLSWGGVGW